MKENDIDMNREIFIVLVMSDIENKTVWHCSFDEGGLMQKGGPLKFLTLVRGALKKINTDFPLQIEFTCFSMGLTRNFHGKKGGGWIFLRSEGGGGWKIFAINIFGIRPPLQVFVNGPLV